jgi:hypothetical protein
MTGPLTNQIGGTMIDQDLLREKLATGMKYVLLHGNDPVMFSRKKIFLSCLRDAVRKKIKAEGLSKSKLAVFPVESLVKKNKFPVGNRRFDAEVERIIALVNPVNDEEMETVKEVAVDNLMRKDMELVVQQLSAMRQ